MLGDTCTIRKIASQNGMRMDAARLHTKEPTIQACCYYKSDEFERLQVGIRCAAITNQSTFNSDALQLQVKFRTQIIEL